MTLIVHILCNSYQILHEGVFILLISESGRHRKDILRLTNLQEYVPRLRGLMPRLRDDVRQLKCLFLTNYCLIAASTKLNLNEKPSICIPFNGNIVQHSIKACFKWLSYFIFFSFSKYYNEAHFSGKCCDCWDYFKKILIFYELM